MRRIALLLAAFVLIDPTFAGPIVQPPQKTEAKSAEQNSTTKSAPLAESGSEERLASYTGWLTFFTGLLVFVSAIQGYFIWRADKTGRITAEAAKKSADIAEKALIDVESPALYPVVNADEFAKSLGWGRGPVKPIEIRLKNVGRLPGFPASIACELFAGGSDETVSDRESGWFPEITLAPGETSVHHIDRNIRRNDGKAVSDEDCAAIMEGRQDVYLSGRLLYMDLFGRQYRQTFCLKWLTAHKAFMAFGPTRNKRDRIKNGKKE